MIIRTYKFNIWLYKNFLNEKYMRQFFLIIIINSKNLTYLEIQFIFCINECLKISFIVIYGFNYTFLLILNTFDRLYLPDTPS